MRVISAISEEFMMCSLTVMACNESGLGYTCYSVVVNVHVALSYLTPGLSALHILRNDGLRIGDAVAAQERNRLF